MESTRYLKDIPVPDGMTEVSIHMLSPMMYIKTYRRHDQIYSQGDPGNAVYLLRGGRVKIYKLSPDGKELTLAIHQPYEIFGEMALVDDGPRDTIAEALDDTCLFVICRRDFESLLHKEPTLAWDIIKLIGRRRREIENQLENLAFRRVSARLALLLMSLAERHGVCDSRGTILNVKLPQHELVHCKIYHDGLG